MKKGYYLAIIFISVCFYACHKADGPKPASIVGSWKQGEMYDTATMAGQVTTFTRPQPSPGVYYRFNSDGSGETKDSNFVVEKFHYKMVNSTSVYCYDDSVLYRGPTPNSISDFFISSSSYTLNILQLNATNMVLSQKVVYTVRNTAGAIESEDVLFATDYTRAQ
jgi:hypothetical protein